MKSKVVFISGIFNVLHPGHLRFIKFAKSKGDKLIVGLFADKILDKEKYNNYLSQEIRFEALSSINYIDKIILINNSIENVISKIRPEIIVKGKEHETKNNIEEKIINKYGGELLFSSGNSSTFFSDFNLSNNNEYIPEIINLPFEFMDRHKITKKSLLNNLKRIKNINMCVVGDLIIDEYIDCDPLGMSREEPNIVYQIDESKFFIGGAGIVAAHASSLGANVNFVSILGNDLLGNYAKVNLKKYNVKHHLYNDKNTTTNHKIRYRYQNKNIFRINNLNQINLNKKTKSTILKKIDKIFKKINLLIISDFNYGLLDYELTSSILDIAKKNNLIISVDNQSSSQLGDLSKFKNINLITPTEYEARSYLQNSNDGLVILAEKLSKKLKSQNTFITLGSGGLLIYAGNDKNNNSLTDRIYPLTKNYVDIAGAGDSLLVLSSIALALNISIWEAALLGMIASAMQINQVGNLPLNLSDLQILI